MDAKKCQGVGPGEKVAIDEEEFNEKLTDIIQRDFFPMVSTGTNDNPDTSHTEESEKNDTLSLDQFLNKYESEDDASFSEMLVRAKKVHDEKHAWLHEKEREYSKLPSSEKLAITGQTQSGSNSWAYTAKNSLMYIPDGVESSAVELVHGASRKREIVHSNTRLPSQFQLKCQHISDTKKPLQEKVGVDGKTASTETPEINGYRFLSTPQIKPGCDASPLMTWGSIEGTPTRIDSDSRPYTASGPSFKMPKISTREKVASRLVDQAIKRTRERKRTALASPMIRGRVGTTPSKLDRLLLLSPAARKLVGNRKYSDKALSASYSPCPHPGQKTPTMAHDTPSTTHNSPSITDNLLHL